MGNIVGRGRYVWGTYPKTSRAAGSALYDTTLYATEFGADPTGVEDSTDALNEFLLATGELKRRGRIPAGTYKISGPLYSHNTGDGTYFTGGIVEGDGRDITIIDWQGAKDTGDAMLTWSRRESVLRDISFQGNYLASYGVAVQNAAGSRVSVTAQTMWQHGIIVPQNWAGLINGFNEECILDHCRADFCGLPEIQQIRLHGDGLGGTFTLTFDGNTTAPIAWNATAEDVADALLAANPDLASPSVSDGGSGQNPFDTTGTLATTLFITLRGLASGHHATVTIDTTNVTGTITLAQTALTREGALANGIHFYRRDSPEGNSDTGTMAIWEPMCRQNAGSGISISGVSIKFWGGHFEGNNVAGIYSGPLTAAGFSSSNMIHWPYFESNYVGGYVAEQSIQNWITKGADIQGASNLSNANDVVLTPNNAGLVVIEPGYYRLQLGTNEQRRIVGQDKDGVTRPLEINASYDRADTVTLDVAGPLVIDLTATGARLTHIIELNANATSFSVTGFVAAMTLCLHIVNSDGARTIAWPAQVKWAGGVAPVLGTGGAGSTDIITLQYVNSSNYREVSRSLAIP